MSHVVAMNVFIKDLDAFGMACLMLGGKFHRNQKTWKWWQKWERDYHQNDAAYKQGIKPEDYGKCEHAASFGTRMGYEVGLVKLPGKEGYQLIFDFIDHELTAKLGGQNAAALIQQYGLAVAEKEVAELTFQGWTVEREMQPNGDIQLKLVQ